MSYASLSPGVGRLAFPRGLWRFFPWRTGAVIRTRLPLLLVCFRGECAAAEITCSAAQRHLLGSRWPDERFDVCVPWARAGLWETNGSAADVWTGNVPSTAAFGLAAWSFWGSSFIFQPVDAMTWTSHCAAWLPLTEGAAKGEPFGKARAPTPPLSSRVPGSSGPVSPQCFSATVPFTKWTSEGAFWASGFQEGPSASPGLA